MTIERTDKREERFWVVSLVSVALLLAVCYILMHSSVILRLVAARIEARRAGYAQDAAFLQKLREYLSYGNHFLLGSGLMLVVAYIFRKSKESLKAGLIIAIAAEALIFLLVVLNRAGMPDPSTCLTVLSGNGLSFLSVLLHKRILF